MLPAQELPKNLRLQTFFCYLLLFAWPLHLFFLPAIGKQHGFLFFVYLIFPGIFLFTRLGFLLHECWHKYIPKVNSKFFFNVFSVMILADPQLFYLVHGYHHRFVHTWEDAEFHPLGEIKSRGVRIIYNWCELLFGVAFVAIVGTAAISHDERFTKRYRFWKTLVAVLASVVFLCVIGFASHAVFKVPVSQIIITYVATYWLGSFILHHSQLIEHGNLIVEGSFAERNIRTRNLNPSGLLERIFLFLTHSDAREHVLHHTVPQVHSRPFPGRVPLPERSVSVTMKDYCGVVGRMMAGKEERKETV
jgi:hypothetical protein